MNHNAKRHSDTIRGEELRGILGSVRRRWRARILLRGASLVVAAGLVAFLGSAYGVEWFRFSATAVTVFRWIAWGTVLGLTFWFVVRPLLRRVTDEQVALYLEEHEPSLEAAILGAVAARDAAGTDPGRAATPRMLDRLVERAIVRARSVDDGRAIEQQALLRHGGVFAALTAGAVVVLLFGPASLRTGVGALMPTRAAAEVNPYSIAVDPGDLTVARGSDQFITAILQGFASDQVSLFTRGGENEPFQRLSMIPAASTDEGVVPFESMLLNLQTDTDYFIESDGIRSPTHRITVADLPYVDRMQHEYRYPNYTGLDPRIVEDAGDIASLRGTRVVIAIEATIPTGAGRIVLDGGEEIELEVGADGGLSGTLEVAREGFYRIELAMDDGTFVEASPRYTIDLLTDAPPMVRFETPGRDSPASPIEEVYLEIQADDDYGVREVLLAYSVNGRPEDTVSVYRDAGPPLTELTVGHTLYLEDYEVEPGDVISYYAVARDQQGPVAEVKSDIYFLTIQPFRREFREQEQQGGGPPQGGGESGMNEERLSELQRQVVAATFNLDRDRSRYDDAEFEESTTAVALAQGRVREQVATLVERMTNRGLTEAEDDFRAIAEMLPEALAAMDTAEVLLRNQEVRPALAPEQRALRVLQKAEETYEVYVGQQQQGGGGGGGAAQANAEDLADLFELELDKLRNQYETVQRGERQQQADEVDEVQQRLQELARRQQQEAERQRARAAQGQQQGGGGGAQSQRELADDTEETARQLERLARETNDRQLQETARQLQEAADAMRRSAAQGGNAGAAESARAQERLAEAQRRLERSRESRVGEDAQNAMDRVERLQQEQREITEQVSNLPENPTQRGEQVRRIQERKTEMAREVGELERDLDRLAADARQEDPAAARELNEAAESIRSSRLNQKILWSRGVVEQREREFARIFEEGLEEDLESLRRQVAEASEAADRLAEGRGMEEALDQAQDLVRGLESLDRRLEGPSTRPDSLAEGEAGEGSRRLGDRPSEEGQEGQAGGQQGQQGQAGGQQGQQGQAGGQQGQQGQAGGQQGQQGQAGGQQGRGGEGQQEGQAGQGGNQAGQSNPQGSPAVDGSTRGGATRGDPTRTFTENDIRQFAREFQERYRQGAELRDALREQGQDVADLDRALEAMRELQDVESYEDLPQIQALRDIVRENLGRVEFTLRRMVEGDAAGRAAIRGSDDVPPGFEQLVEEYYRNLARSGGGGG